jgi:hypothetical protein
VYIADHSLGGRIIDFEGLLSLSADKLEEGMLIHLDCSRDAAAAGNVRRGFRKCMEILTSLLINNRPSNFGAAIRIFFSKRCVQRGRYKVLLLL